MLITSQRNIIRQRSNEEKYNKAACEKRALSVTIVLAFESYSKYSIKKKKHKTKANVSIAKKNAEISSKQRARSTWIRSSADSGVPTCR